MEKQNLKSKQYILGIFLLLSGIVLIVLLSGTLRYLGIGLITMAYIYFVVVFYSKFSDSEDEHFSKQTREEILKYQFRK